MDVHDKTTRSYNMSQIKGKNTKPEEKVRKYLFSQGFRFRKNYKRLPGTPDIVLPRYRTVIFVNGCFWHGHEGCKYFVMPKSRTDFWQAKITRNQERDKEVKKQLAKMGWHSMTIWECELKTTKRDATLESLQYTLNKIYLQNHQVRKYEIPKDETQMMVAEDNMVLYEKGHSYKDT